jgi:predicted protein tyrosine phosphatase
MESQQAIPTATSNMSFFPEEYLARSIEFFSNPISIPQAQSSVAFSAQTRDPSLSSNQGKAGPCVDGPWGTNVDLIKEAEFSMDSNNLWLPAKYRVVSIGPPQADIEKATREEADAPIKAELLHKTELTKEARRLKKARLRQKHKAELPIKHVPPDWLCGSSAFLLRSV